MKSRNLSMEQRARAGLATVLGMKRTSHVDRLRGGTFDVLIIGSGINGAVSAAALAGHDLDVALIDRGDYAGFTSQESSNMVWGGFKYLQSYEFALVRKLSKARNRLVESYPSSVTPIDFLALFDEHSPFPTSLAAAGSYVYWAIGNFATKRPRPLSATKVEALEPVINTEHSEGGLLYADALLEDNDSRFVFGFVQEAARQGATITNYVELTSASLIDNRWHVELTDQTSGEVMQATTRVLVNATGPFVDPLNEILGVVTEHRIALSKGIHLVVPRIGSGERVLAFFDEDERLYYVLPMDDRSVIGTTDTRVDSPFTEVTDEDRDFVLRQINRRLDLENDLTIDDIISERTGVRPLVVKAGTDATPDTDWLQLSRRHEIELDRERGVISIFGGKLTDCLNVGEEVVEAASELGLSPSEPNERWFGEPPATARQEFQRRAAAQGLGRTIPGDPMMIWRRYGADAFAVLEHIVRSPELVWDDPPFHQGELEWVGANEHVTNFEDFARRRSSLALTADQDALEAAAPTLRSALGL